MIKYLVIGVLLIAAPGFPCVFDLDCEFGSRCLKVVGEIYGQCSGGFNPGRQYDAAPPAVDPFKPSQGDTCRSNFDCGLGGQCAKSIGSFKGVCQ